MSSLAIEKTHSTTITIDFRFNNLGMQGWCSGESTRLPPMLPGFDFQIWHYMWVELVGSLLCTKRFSLGAPVSPLLNNQHLT